MPFFVLFLSILCSNFGYLYSNVSVNAPITGSQLTGKGKKAFHSVNANNSVSKEGQHDSQKEASNSDEKKQDPASSENSKDPVFNSNSRTVSQSEKFEGGAEQFEGVKFLLAIESTQSDMSCDMRLSDAGNNAIRGRIPPGVLQGLQGLQQGVSQLPTRMQAQVQNFLNQFLGGANFNLSGLGMQNALNHVGLSSQNLSMSLHPGDLINFLNGGSMGSVSARMKNTAYGVSTGLEYGVPIEKKFYVGGGVLFGYSSGPQEKISLSGSMLGVRAKSDIKLKDVQMRSFTSRLFVRFGYVIQKFMPFVSAGYQYQRSVLTHDRQHIPGLDKVFYDGALFSVGCDYKPSKTIIGLEFLMSNQNGKPDDKVHEYCKLDLKKKDRVFRLRLLL